MKIIIVLKLFSILRNSEYKEKHFDKINYKEYLYFEKANNAGLTYCKPGIYNCYGYDLKAAYASILGSKYSLFKIL